MPVSIVAEDENHTLASLVTALNILGVIYMVNEKRQARGYLSRLIVSDLFVLLMLDDKFVALIVDGDGPEAFQYGLA